jgi:hypothetical protein
MSNKPTLPVLAAALLCCSAPAWSQSAPPNFPDGPGKDTVVAVCGGCHDINRLRAGYTPAGWNMIPHMMQNMEAPVAPEDWPTVITYLMKRFPEKPRPPAAVLAGPVQASIKLWDVPTLGSRPHDPLAAKDGAIWWAGQLSNKLGRIDPKTGEVKLVTSPTPKSAALRDGGQLEKRRVLRRVRRRQGRHYRRQDHGHQGIRSARPRRAPTPHRDLTGRRDLVNGFRARLPWPPRSGDRQGQRMAIAERA